jgi:hypothetical protein
MSSTLHNRSYYRNARFDSRPYSFCKNLKDNERHGAADLDDRPKFFLPSSFSIYSVDLTDDGKLGHGFMSADELEEVDIGHGDKPRPTFGKINFVRRFIFNLSGRIEPFMELVKIKANEEFRWGAEQQQAFEEIKEYLSKPPVLVPPQQDRPCYVYLSVGDTSIALVLIQVHDNKERAVFYLSRRMLEAETRYPDIKKLCLCLFFTCTKLHHILLSAEVIIICKSDVIKHMQSAPVLRGRLGKWMFALSEFDIRYNPRRRSKGKRW